MSSDEKKFHYSENDFVYHTSWQQSINITRFDGIVNTYWITAMDNNYFRFKLDTKESKHLEGKFGFIAEFHPDRKLKRRPPQALSDMDDPFDPNAFNFTKILEREVILQFISPEAGVTSTGKNLMIINDSPLSASHCLILPQVDLMLPQVLTHHASVLALHTLLLSADPSMRIGFNSICGFASVNHLHLHSFIIPEKMFLETVPLKVLEGPCYEVDQYAVKGFCFESELQDLDDVVTLARHTHKLTTLLQERKIAHNVNWIRSGDSHSHLKRNKVRVFVWARKNSSVKTTGLTLSAALSEFLGLLVFKVEDSYQNATEANVCELLEDITSSIFHEVRSAVRDLFRQNKTLNNT